ncbi:MAG: LapA family protein [Polaromonas sp.]
MKYLMWLLKAAIFFTLFAFALNNQQAVAVYFFFGTLWKAPLVLVVLSAFSSGLALGVLLMMPRWWKRRQKTRSTSATESRTADTSSTPAASMETTGIPRHGL